MVSNTLNCHQHDPHQVSFGGLSSSICSLAFAQKGQWQTLVQKKQSTQKCGKIHPLVNVYITSPWYIGKPTLNHQFSIAMLVYQRVFLVGDTRLACWSLSVSLDFTVRTFFAPRAIAWGRLYHPIVSIPGSFTMALIPVVSIPFSMD